MSFAVVVLDEYIDGILIKIRWQISKWEVTASAFIIDNTNNIRQW